MRKVIFIIIALLIAAFLMLICYQDPVFMYGSTSCVYTTKIGVLPYILFFAFCIIRFIKFKKKKLKLSLMIGVAIFWVLSGRVIGYNSCQNEIVCGWHNFIPTKEIKLGNALPSPLDNKNVQINKLPFWRLQVTNEKISTTIFVSPFIWNETLEVFKESGFTINVSD